MIGKGFKTNSKPIYKDDYKKEKGKVKRFGGQAEPGKTYKLWDMVSNTIPQRMSKANWKPNKICRTFDSYFKFNGRTIDKVKDQVLFIKEFSMVPNKWITMLGNIIYMFGDPNQCSPVQGSLWLSSQ